MKHLWRVTFRVPFLLTRNTTIPSYKQATTHSMHFIILLFENHTAIGLSLLSHIAIVAIYLHVFLHFQPPLQSLVHMIAYRYFVSCMNESIVICCYVHVWNYSYFLLLRAWTYNINSTWPEIWALKFGTLCEYCMKELRNGKLFLSDVKIIESDVKHIEDHVRGSLTRNLVRMREFIYCFLENNNMRRLLVHNM